MVKIISDVIQFVAFSSEFLSVLEPFLNNPNRKIMHGDPPRQDGQLLRVVKVARTSVELFQSKSTQSRRKGGTYGCKNYQRGNRRAGFMRKKRLDDIVKGLK